MADYLQPLIYRPDEWTLSVVTAPTVEPVTSSEAMQQAIIDFNDDSDLLDALIQAAREHVENFTERALITQTRELKIRRFPRLADQIILLPGGKLQSVSSISYTDTDGDTQVWASSNYDVETSSEPGRINLAYDKDWPEVRELGLPIAITYICGYPGDGGSPEDLRANVPQAIKQAVKMLVAHLYQNREAVTDMQMSELPLAFRSLLMPYKCSWLHT